MEKELISVCICTYKRVDLLQRLLDCLKSQLISPEFLFEAVIVDNDRAQSAEKMVRSHPLQATIKVIYDCETIQNISLTRNLAIRKANGNLITFIDDDEYPIEGWLDCLYRTYKRYSSDGVLGPVLPDFPLRTPNWLKKGNFFNRRRLPTGTPISGKDARTGNVLFKKSIFVEGEPWFDPAFGRTGGEDSDFFARQFRQGRVFTWCDEAIVYETVPPERLKAGYHIKKYLRSGTLDGEIFRRHDTQIKKMEYIKNLIVLGGGILVIPFLFLTPKYVWMRIGRKLAYSFGFAMAAVGLSVLRHRS